jgi:hypothetical protein
MKERQWKMLTLAAGIAAMLSAGTALAEDLAGTWTLSIDTPRGLQNPTLDIEKNGAGYSGTYNSLRGPIEIEKISRDGNTFAFPLTISVPIGDVEVNYTGSFEGSEMQGMVESPRGQVPFTATKND